MKRIPTTAIQHMIEKSSAAIKSTGTGFMKLLIKHPQTDKIPRDQVLRDKKLQGKILSYRQRFSHRQDILF